MSPDHPTGPMDARLRGHDEFGRVGLLAVGMRRVFLFDQLRLLARDFRLRGYDEYGRRPREGREWGGCVAAPYARK